MGRRLGGQQNAEAAKPPRRRWQTRRGRIGRETSSAAG